MSVQPYYANDTVTLHAGNCLDVLADLGENSVDAVVTDPPYELGFMGRAWDASGIAYNVEVWRECLRVLKPGGHLLAFGGTRTYHRMTCAIEDAGFEIRDSLHWIYGSGFPKSLDVSKAIDKRRDDHGDIVRVTSWLADRAEAAGVSRADVDQRMGTSDMGGWWLSRLPHRSAVPTWEQWQQLRTLIGCGDDMDAEVWRLNGRKGTPGEAWDQREVIGKASWDNSANHFVPGEDHTQRVHLDVTAPATPDAVRWQGWGTALKPAHEPIVLARKPLGGTVAATVLAHGTGALNIDACRTPGTAQPFGNGTRRTAGIMGESEPRGAWSPTAEGRWPANVVLTHPPALDAAGDVVGDACADGCVDGCPVAEMDAQSGIRRAGAHPAKRAGVGYHGGASGTAGDRIELGDGGASRFFPVFRYQAKASRKERPRLADGTSHPTVKPLALMSWLVTLVTPPGGLVCDPFLGSGTTAEACIIEGFRCVGVELDENHLKLTKARLPGSVQPTLA